MSDRGAASFLRFIWGRRGAMAQGLSQPETGRCRCGAQGRDAEGRLNPRRERKWSSFCVSFSRGAAKRKGRKKRDQTAQKGPRP